MALLRAVREPPIAVAEARAAALARRTRESRAAAAARLYAR